MIPAVPSSTNGDEVFRETGHVTPSLPVTTDPLQFAYQTNRSTDDAMSHLLHTLSGSPRATETLAEGIKSDMPLLTTGIFNTSLWWNTWRKRSSRFSVKPRRDARVAGWSSEQRSKYREWEFLLTCLLMVYDINLLILIRHINQKSKLNGLSMSVISLCVTAGLIPHSEIISHPGVKGAFSWILGDFPASSLISSSHLCHNLAQPIRLKASCFFK